MVAVIGVLVIVTLVVGGIIGSQALATTTLSAAAEQQDVESAMPEDCPGENHDTYHRDMHGGSDARHSGMHRH